MITSTPAQKKEACRFVRANSPYVDCGNVSPLQFERTDSFSISLWFKSTYSGATQVLVAKSASATAAGYALVLLTSGLVQMRITNTDATNCLVASLSTNALNDGGWHHVVVTYNGTSLVAGIRGYIDGFPIGNASTTSNLSATVATSAAFRIGANGAGSYFDGKIDEVGVYNVALTAANARTLYNDGAVLDLSGGPAGLVGYWRMGEGAAYPSIPDDSSNSNAGTMTSMERANITSRNAGDRDVMDLDFTEQIFTYEIFTSDRGQFTEFTGSTASAGTFAVTGNQGVITCLTGTNRDRFVQMGKALGIAQGWIQADVAATTGVPNSYNIGLVGWSLDENNGVYAGHDHKNNETRIHLVLSGVATVILIAQSISPDYQIALSIFNNRLTVFTDATMTETFTQILQYDIPASVGDLTAVDLSAWRPTIAAAAANNATCVWTFDNVKTSGRVNPFELLPLSLRQFNETFASDVGQFTTFTASTTATFAVSAGTGVLSQAIAAARDIFVQRGSDLDVPQFFAQVDVTATSGASGIMGIGIAKDANNFCVLDWNRGTNTVRWSVKYAGNFAQTVVTGVTLTAPFKLGFSAVLGSVAAWKDVGKGWEMISVAELLAIVTGFDMRTLNLTGWKPCLSHAASIINSETVDNWQFGRFGAVGVRDQTWVANENGTPYESGGLNYLTASCADPRGISYMAVFSRSVATGKLTQVGAILTSRGGLTYGDLSGHVVTDGTDSKLWTSSWGNGFGGVLDVLYADVPATNLLSGSHIVAVASLTLPGVPVGGGAYDPVVAKDDGVWYCGYTITDDTDFVGSPFYAALASSLDLASWSQIGSPDTANKPFEGSKLFRTQRGFCLMSGGSSTVRVYDMDMSYRGLLSITTRGGSSTYPHPAAAPVSGKQLIATFNDQKFGAASFTWGHWSLFEAAQYQ